MDLVGICEIEGKTENQKKIIIRARIDSWGLDDERLLGPIVEIKSKATSGNTSPQWGELTQKNRPDNVVGPGTYERDNL